MYKKPGLSEFVPNGTEELRLSKSGCLGGSVD